MTYVIAATYVARDGEAEGVRSALLSAIPPSRAEPGCITYRAHRSVQDPSVFFLYEEYVDADGFKAHAESDHFDRFIRGQAWPLLESRTVVRAEPL